VHLTTLAAGKQINLSTILMCLSSQSLLVICVSQEVASLENDTEKTREFQSELDELEERAKELDQRRTNNISAVRSALATSFTPDLVILWYIKFDFVKISSSLTTEVMSKLVVCQSFFCKLFNC